MTPRSYEIRIRGKLGDPLLASFEGLDASIKPAETVLRGAICDQAALHGLLDQIQALGLDLAEVRELHDFGGGPAPTTSLRKTQGVQPGHPWRNPLRPARRGGDQ